MRPRRQQAAPPDFNQRAEDVLDEASNERGEGLGSHLDDAASVISA